MSDNRCGTCAHYKARRKLRKHTVGVCLAPVPECVRDERDDCHSTDGATCKVWARIGVSIPSCYPADFPVQQTGVTTATTDMAAATIYDVDGKPWILR